MTRAIPLDWRRLHTKLESHIDGQGGVIHVKAGEDEAPRTFVDILRNVWLRDAPAQKWVTLPVDAWDDTLRYPLDLVRGIANLTGVTLPYQRSTAPRLDIAQGVRARRDVTISAEVQIDMHDGYGRQLERDDLEALCEGLRSFLRNGRLALIFIDTHELNAALRKRLAHTVWHDRLEALVENGLLIVSVFDPAKLTLDGSGFPPQPTTIVNLADYFSSQEDREQARADLAAHSMSLNWHQDASHAHDFANTVVTISKTMKDLQANLATYSMSKGSNDD